MVKGWLEDLGAEGSKLTRDADGVRTSTKARPGTVVVPIAVVRLLESLVTSPTSILGRALQRKD